MSVFTEYASEFEKTARKDRVAAFHGLEGALQELADVVYGPGTPWTSVTALVKQAAREITAPYVGGISRPDGPTDAEGIVADALVAAVRAWGKLPWQHPDENREFVDAIHRLQNLLTIRIARRHYPDGWPTRSPHSSRT
jgi:hypothetical protein